MDGRGCVRPSHPVHPRLRFPESRRARVGAPSASPAAWAVLMGRLGYDRYVAQGGDWGAFVVDYMGVQAPQGLLGIHPTCAGTVPVTSDKATRA